MCVPCSTLHHATAHTDVVIGQGQMSAELIVQGRATQPSDQLQVSLVFSIDEMNYRSAAKPIERTSVTLQQELMVDILVDILRTERLGIEQERR
jgi:hypothetical protein